MRLVPLPANTPRPEQFPTSRRPEPQRRYRWVGPLTLAGAIAGTMWMAATPITTTSIPQGLQILAGAAAGLAIALLIAGPPAPKPQRATAPAPAPRPARTKPPRAPGQRVVPAITTAPVALDLDALPPSLRDAVTAPPTPNPHQGP